MRLLILILLCLFQCKRDRGYEKEKIDTILHFNAYPGDGFVYLEWEYVSRLSPIREGTCMLIPVVNVYRAEKGGKFRMLDNAMGKADYYSWTPYPEQSKHGNALDTTVINGKTYAYYIKVDWGGGYEIVCPFYSVSETLEVTPLEGLSDPVPMPPCSVWIERNDSLHLFTLHWIPPEGSDSFYYLVESPGGPEGWNPNWYGFTFDNLTDWYPALHIPPSMPDTFDGMGYFPEPYYTFPDCGEWLRPDKPDTIWYYIIARVRGRLSYPSKPVFAVHID
ncbi:MAG: hypothetical protein ABIN20_03170 [candidate division WOR-3 bacterium]